MHFVRKTRVREAQKRPLMSSDGHYIHEDP